jgi:hypothetical protein
MDPQHLAKQRRVVLRVATGLDVASALVVARAAVAGSDVKIVIVARARTKSDPAAIVIRLWMIERQQNFFI